MIIMKQQFSHSSSNKNVFQKDCVSQFLFSFLFFFFSVLFFFLVFRTWKAHCIIEEELKPDF